MNISISGLPALAGHAGFVVVTIWLGARIVGADHQTFLRAGMALVLGMAGALLGFAAGPAVLLIAPLVFLLSFRFVLGTSFGGALLVAIVVAVCYTAMGHLIGGDTTISPLAVKA